jgi:hypothetical protein
MVENVPSAHERQPVLLPDALLANFPTGHAVQTKAPDVLVNVPGGHALQNAFATALSEKYPSAQATQDVLEFVKLPCLQERHVEDADVFEKYPFSQGIQACSWLTAPCLLWL